MNKLVAPFAAIAFVFSIAIAQADETAGKVAQVDPAAGSITLEDGTTFTIAEGVSMEGLEPGTEVTVSFEEQDGQLIATEVAPSNYVADPVQWHGKGGASLYAPFFLWRGMLGRHTRAHHHTPA